MSRDPQTISKEVYIKLVKENEELENRIKKLENQLEDTNATKEILKSQNDALKQEIENKSGRPNNPSLIWKTLFEARSKNSSSTKENHLTEICSEKQNPLFILLEKIHDQLIQSLLVILKNESTSNFDGIPFFKSCQCELPAPDLYQLRVVYNNLLEKERALDDYQSYFIDDDKNLHLICSGCAVEFIVQKDEIFTDYSNVLIPLTVYRKIQMYLTVLRLKNSATQVDSLKDLMDEMIQPEYDQILIKLINENEAYLDLKDIHQKNMMFYILKNKNKELFLFIKATYPEKFKTLCLEKNNQGFAALTAVIDETLNEMIESKLVNKEFFQNPTLADMILEILKSEEVNYLLNNFDIKTIETLLHYFCADEALTHASCFMEQLKKITPSTHNVTLNNLKFLPKTVDEKSIEIVSFLINQNFFRSPDYFNLPYWLEGLEFENINQSVFDFIQLIINTNNGENDLPPIFTALEESLNYFLTKSIQNSNTNTLSPKVVLDRLENILSLNPKNNKKNKTLLLLKLFFENLIMTFDKFISENTWEGNLVYSRFKKHEYKTNCEKLEKMINEYLKIFRSLKSTSKKEEQYNFILSMIKELLSDLKSFSFFWNKSMFLSKNEIPNIKKKNLNQIFVWLLPFFESNSAYVHRLSFFHNIFKLAIDKSFLKFRDKNNEPILFTITPLLENQDLTQKLYDLIEPLKQEYNCAELFFRTCDIYFNKKEIPTKFISLVDYQKLDAAQISIFSKKIIDLEIWTEIKKILKSVKKSYENEVCPLLKQLRFTITTELKEKLAEKLPGYLVEVCKEARENRPKKRKRSHHFFPMASDYKENANDNRINKSLKIGYFQ